MIALFLAPLLLAASEPRTAAVSVLEGQATKARASGRPTPLSVGTPVAQGDTLGYVGQTGWATGPHLHYEFRVSGAARNPLSVPLPAGTPVAAHDMAPQRESAGCCSNRQKVHAQCER